MGYLLGWMLLYLAASGMWAAAIILPLYYIADATLTLLKRVLRKESLHTPHKTHFYQIAATRTNNHGLVTRRIIMCNIWLIIAAVASVSYPMIALFAAFWVTAGTIALLLGIQSADDLA